MAGMGVAPAALRARLDRCRAVRSGNRVHGTATPGRRPAPVSADDSGAVILGIGLRRRAAGASLHGGLLVAVGFQEAQVAGSAVADGAPGVAAGRLLVRGQDQTERDHLGAGVGGLADQLDHRRGAPAQGGRLVRQAEQVMREPVAVGQRLGHGVVGAGQAAGDEAGCGGRGGLAAQEGTQPLPPDGFGAIPVLVGLDHVAAFGAGGGAFVVGHLGRGLAPAAGIVCAPARGVATGGEVGADVRRHPRTVRPRPVAYIRVVDVQVVVPIGVVTVAVVHVAVLVVVLIGVDPRVVEVGGVAGAGGVVVLGERLVVVCEISQSLDRLVVPAGSLDHGDAG